MQPMSIVDTQFLSGIRTSRWWTSNAVIPSDFGYEELVHYFVIILGL